MKLKSRRADQIIGIVKEHEAGKKAPDLARRTGFRSTRSTGGGRSTGA